MSLKRVTRRTRVTSPKIAAIVRSLNLTLWQYRAWVGCGADHPLTCFLTLNPQLSIRDLYDLLVEHQHITSEYQPHA